MAEMTLADRVRMLAAMAHFARPALEAAKPRYDSDHILARACRRQKLRGAPEFLVADLSQ
jgi:hypothetical protein